jgi:hypothetical protein
MVKGRPQGPHPRTPPGPHPSQRGTQRREITGRLHPVPPAHDNERRAVSVGDGQPLSQEARDRRVVCRNAHASSDPSRAFLGHRLQRYPWSYQRSPRRTKPGQHEGVGLSVPASDQELFPVQQPRHQTRRRIRARLVGVPNLPGPGQTCQGPSVYDAPRQRIVNHQHAVRTPGRRRRDVDVAVVLTDSQRHGEERGGMCPHGDDQPVQRALEQVYRGGR